METPKPHAPKPLSFRPPAYAQGSVEKVERFNESAAMAGEAVKNFNDTADAEPLEFKSFKKPEAKKPFELKPHLTQRPFHDERLMQLKNRIQRPSFKNR